MPLTDDLQRMLEAAAATRSTDSMPIASVSLLWEWQSDDAEDNAITIETRIYNKINMLMAMVRSGELRFDTAPYADGQEQHDNDVDDPFRVRVNLWDLARWARTCKQFPEFLQPKSSAISFAEMLDRAAETLSRDIHFTASVS